MPDLIVPAASADAELPRWQEFITTESPAFFARTWLQHLLASHPGINTALVLMLRSTTGKLVLAANWPEDRPVDLKLNAAVEECIKRSSAVVLPVTVTDSKTVSLLCYPVKRSDQLIAIVAVNHAETEPARLESFMMSLRWHCGWLELFYSRRHTSEDKRERQDLVALLNVLAGALEQRSYEGTALAAVNELATLMRCSRASIGRVVENRNTVGAISGVTEFANKAKLLRAIGNAMDEAFDQQASIAWPHRGKNVVLLNDAQSALGNFDPVLAHAVCSVPLPGDQAYIGVLTLERTLTEPFTEAELEFLELVSAMLGPVLLNRSEAERPWWGRLRDGTTLFLSDTFGPRHYLRKSAGIAAVLIFGFLALYPADYRVTADARLESTIRRAIVAPTDGFVEDAFVRAGDIIAQGQPLYSLDARDLKLEQLRWQSEKLQMERQIRDAVALREPAKVRVYEAQVAQAGAQLELVNEQLARIHASSPFAGYVITGDLSQSLGVPVSRGEVLFELAPLDSYRVVLLVDEQDIDSIAQGQTGAVILRSGSEATMEFAVERIVPLAEAYDGRNVFRVEARLQQLPDYLRPGMEGVGKVNAGTRSLLWIWTHRFTDWLRLALWEWV